MAWSDAHTICKCQWMTTPSTLNFAGNKHAFADIEISILSGQESLPHFCRPSELCCCPSTARSTGQWMDSNTAHMAGGSVTGSPDHAHALLQKARLAVLRMRWSSLSEHISPKWSWCLTIWTKVNALNHNSEEPRLQLGCLGETLPLCVDTGLWGRHSLLSSLQLWRACLRGPGLTDPRFLVTDVVANFCGPYPSGCLLLHVFSPLVHVTGPHGVSSYLLIYPVAWLTIGALL